MPGKIKSCQKGHNMGAGQASLQEIFPSLLITLYILKLSCRGQGDLFLVRIYQLSDIHHSDLNQPSEVRELLILVGEKKE